MDYDDFKLREMKQAEAGRLFKAPSGSRFQVTADAILPHVIRVSIQRAGAKGKVLADLGYEDVHFAPEQDLEALLLKNVKMRIFNAADVEKAGAAAGEYLASKWGAPPP